MSKKIERRHNKKGRKIVNVSIDESEQKKIKLDDSLQHDTEKYDLSNALVLPSKKRKTKKLKDPNAAPVKLLSRKHRKKLEKIVELKGKKERRKDLLEALKEVQASPQDLEKLTSLQTIQTLGRKKYLNEEFCEKKSKHKSKEIRRMGSIIKGAIRNNCVIEEKKGKRPLNVVGLRESSSDDSEEEHLECNEDDKTIDMLSNLQQIQDIDAKIPQAIKIENEIIVNSSKTQKSITYPVPKLHYISVARLKTVQDARLKLPILSEEHEVMEAINENPISIVVGPTGSGKTTQVPQFLYEAGYARGDLMIGVTEPRRVAAMSMSKRVAEELDLSTDVVSYQIRFDGNTTDKTKIKFMTDGVLLKEIQMDPTLKKYSVIIIDEAHERSVYSDILIGILSRIIPKRYAKGKPLKLVIMSATLRVEDFTKNTKLFRELTPPVVKVESRMYDVTVHFNKRTPEDYMTEALKKVCRIHKQLPEGGILVFVTGQLEVNTLCRKLELLFPQKHYMNGANCNLPNKELKNKENTGGMKAEGKTLEVVIPKVSLNDFLNVLPDLYEEESEVITEDNEIATASNDLQDMSAMNDNVTFQPPVLQSKSASKPLQPLHVLPLYSMLPPARQQLVFKPPLEGSRLCVVATNVAETSLTIPSIKYVVDTGKVKEKIYDPVTGVSMFQIRWVSQASANQRAGRAGRTSPGHCYRLYSSAIFNNEFEPHSKADILKRPIDDLVLVMKAMRLPVVNFPFPTPPDGAQLKEGLRRLIILSALREVEDNTTAPNAPVKDTTFITELGRAMSSFPVSPRYAKMLVLSQQYPPLIPYTIALVAALTIPEVLLEKAGHNNDKSLRMLRERWLGQGHRRLLGDLSLLLSAIGGAEYEGGSQQWSEKNGLRHKAVVEVRKLRLQLTKEMNAVVRNCNLYVDPKMAPPDDNKALLLRQIVLSGSLDRVAKKAKLDKNTAEEKFAYKPIEMDEVIYLPKSCSLRTQRPDWIVYQETYETSSAKIYVRGVTAIEPQWLATLAPHMCSLSPPLSSPKPFYDNKKDVIFCYREGTFGPCLWELPQVCVPYPVETSLHCWLGFFLLTGELCSTLTQFLPLLNEPSSLISPIAIRFSKERKALTNALIIQNVTNYNSLQTAWQKSRTYLLNEYLMWLKIKDNNIETKIRSIWPPYNKELLKDT